MKSFCVLGYFQAPGQACGVLGSISSTDSLLVFASRRTREWCMEVDSDSKQYILWYTEVYTEE